MDDIRTESSVFMSKNNIVSDTQTIKPCGEDSQVFKPCSEDSNFQPRKPMSFNEKSGSFTLKDLCRQLHTIFSEDHVNIESVEQLLNHYKSNRNDWAKYAKFDPHRYTRNLVDSGNGRFNLMILCWGEGHGSSIHDHSNSHCFVKVLDGCLKESLYEWPKNEKNCEAPHTSKHSGEEIDELGRMKLVSEITHTQNAVTYINDTMGVHRMENPSHSNCSVTLHLYIPPFQSCQIFDDRTGHTQEVKVTFWSKYGKRTPFKPKNKSQPVPENN